MKKRLWASILALVMVITILPLPVSAASITEIQVTTRLNELRDGKYKPGTKYSGSGECLGFAVDVFNYIFGTSLSKGNYPKARFSNPAGLKEVGHLDSNYTSSDLASLLKNAKPGDMLLIADPGKSYGHAMIIWSVSSSGQPTVYDANASSANKLYNITSNAIDIHSYSTQTASKYHSDAATLYRYTDYEDGARQKGNPLWITRLPNWSFF